ALAHSSISFFAKISIPQDTFPGGNKQELKQNIVAIVREAMNKSSVASLKKKRKSREVEAVLVRSRFAI
ncbi:hypothetical protein V1478_009320, partial [Vespula squamosa]